MSALAWSLTGNTATSPDVDFVGTKDNEPLTIRTQNVERLRVDSAGNVGIGTTTPSEKLTVQGNILVTAGIGIGIGDHRDIGVHNNKLLVDGNLHMDGNPIYLREGFSDQMDGLQWFGTKKFANASLDGPVLFGWSGGALGSTDGGQKIVLRWNSDGKGNVLISGILDCGGPIRVGDNVVINDHDIRLRAEADAAHGLSWYGPGKPWSHTSGDPGPVEDIAPDGPVLWGCRGGFLATANRVTALAWDDMGDISVSGSLHVNDDVTVCRDLIMGDGRCTGLKSVVSNYLDLNPKFPAKASYTWKPPSVSGIGLEGDYPEGIRISNQSYTGAPWVIFHNALDATDDYSLQFVHGRDSRKGRSGVGHVAFMEDGSIDITGWLKIGNRWAAKPGGGEWTDTSDERLKRNIRPLNGALTELLKLQGVTYEWKEPQNHGDLTGTQIGFIGQEVEKVFPDWVSTDRDGYKLLSIRGFSALSVEAFRELKRLVDILTRRVEALELNQHTP